MSEITVTATCAEGHSQALRVDGKLGLEWAKMWAGLMDGTSPLYIYPPIGTDSLIGKCGICGSQIKCSVEDTVDRTARELSGGGHVTEDHREIDAASGQQKGYIVLTQDERAKGFVRPVRRTYIHVGLDPRMQGVVLLRPGQHGCGHRTTMALDIAETYARDPKFYSGTFCTSCGTHRPLEEFVWEGTTEQVGS